MLRRIPLPPTRQRRGLLPHPSRLRGPCSSRLVPFPSRARVLWATAPVPPAPMAVPRIRRVRMADLPIRRVRMAARRIRKARMADLPIRRVPMAARRTRKARMAVLPIRRAPMAVLPIRKARMAVPPIRRAERSAPQAASAVRLAATVLPWAEDAPSPPLIWLP